MTSPPFAPDLDAIRWIEDPSHGPSRKRRLSCWLVFWRPCPHEREKRMECAHVHDPFRCPSHVEGCDCPDDLKVMPR